jgi:hypothetical protein
MNLADYNIGGDNPQSVLMVGDSGTGKSIAAAYYKNPADDRNVYFLSCDGRMGSVAEWHRGRKDIEFEIVNKYEELDQRIEELIINCPYQTLIVDPITNISAFLMRYSFALRGITSMEWNAELGKAESKTTSKGKKRGNVDLTSYDDIAIEHRGIEDLILNMRIIKDTHKTNIILIAHLLTTTYTKVGGGESNIRRDIVTAGKKIVPFIPTQFDEVYNFQAENGRWFVKTYNDGIVQARSSFLLMPKEIDWTERNFYELVSKYYIQSEKGKQDS